MVDEWRSRGSGAELTGSLWVDFLLKMSDFNHLPEAPMKANDTEQRRKEVTGRQGEIKREIVLNGEAGKQLKLQ